MRQETSLRADEDRGGCFSVPTHLQCTVMGPSCPNCSLVLCTCPMKSMKPSPVFGTPCSGQSVNWNWRMVRDWPSCRDRGVRREPWVSRQQEGLISLSSALVLLTCSQTLWPGPGERVHKPWISPGRSFTECLGTASALPCSPQGGSAEQDFGPLQGLLGQCPGPVWGPAPP